MVVLSKDAFLPYLNRGETLFLVITSTWKHAQNIKNTEIKLLNTVIISMFLACFTPVPSQNIRDCL
jgi:hypothetical protein